MFNNRKKAVVALIVATLIWASTYAVVKVGLQNIAPFTLALIRGVLATVILFIFCLVNGLLKESLYFIKKHFLTALTLGAVGTFLLHSFNNLGLKYSSSIMGGVLINTSPILILFLSIIFLKERANSNKIFGIVLGFAGIIFITFIGEDFSNFTSQNTFFGNILLLGVALSWAIYSVIIKKFLNKFNPLTLTFVSYLIGTLFFIPVVFFTEDLTMLYSYNFQSWAIILYLGILGSATAYLLWNYGVKQFEVSKASIYQYLSPALAILLGFSFLHEKVSTFDVFGIILIFSGIYFSERTIKKIKI